MAFKNIVVPWLSAGGLLLGYAGLSWLRARRRAPSSTHQADENVAPLSATLEHVPEELVLDLDELDLPANGNGGLHASKLGASFLGRATGGLSPFSHPGEQSTRGPR